MELVLIYEQYFSLTEAGLGFGQTAEWQRERINFDLPDDFKISLFEDEDVEAEKLGS